MLIQEAVILAGGKGTRLKEVVSDVPKVMARVNGRPFLEYILDYLNHNLINHVVLSVGYKHEIIQNHFGNRYKNINLEYAVEETPLGTGGGIKKAFRQIKGYRAYVFNGDTLFLIDLTKITDFHRSKQTLFSLVLRKTEDIRRYGEVKVNENGLIEAFKEKGGQQTEGLINGGAYLIDKKFFEHYSFPDAFSLEKDCFEKLVDQGIFYGVICKQYFIDMGIPDDFKRAQDEFKTFEY